MTALTVPDAADRADLGSFVARLVRLDPATTVRLLATPHEAPSRVTAWAGTPFDVLATRSVPGALEPGDVTVGGAALLTALTVERAGTVDPGAGARWAGELPPTVGWAAVDDVPAAELEGLTERGLALAREHGASPSPALLDQTVLTVTSPGQPAVRVPLRCLFALSGLGLFGDTGDGDTGDGDTGDGDGRAVRVSATGSWLRLDARYGAVVRRRLTALPLLVG